MCYLIFQSLLCLYLLICLVTVNDIRDMEETHAEEMFRRANSWFVFICLIPFIVLRIVALMCCKAPRYIKWQVFGIWFLNLVLMEAWFVYAIV